MGIETARQLRAKRRRPEPFRVENIYSAPYAQRIYEKRFVDRAVTRLHLVRLEKAWRAGVGPQVVECIEQAKRGLAKISLTARYPTYLDTFRPDTYLGLGLRTHIRLFQPDTPHGQILGLACSMWPEAVEKSAGIKISTTVVDGAVQMTMNFLQHC